MNKYFAMLLKVLFVCLPAVYGYYVLVFLLFFDSQEIIYKETRQLSDGIAVIEIIE